MSIKEAKSRSSGSLSIMNEGRTRHAVEMVATDRDAFGSATRLGLVLLQTESLSESFMLDFLPSSINGFSLKALYTSNVIIR